MQNRQFGNMQLYPIIKSQLFQFFQEWIPIVEKFRKVSYGRFGRFILCKNGLFFCDFESSGFDAAGIILVVGDPKISVEF